MFSNATWWGPPAAGTGETIARPTSRAMWPVCFLLGSGPSVLLSRAPRCVKEYLGTEMFEEQRAYSELKLAAANAYGRAKRSDALTVNERQVRELNWNFAEKVRFCGEKALQQT